MHLRGKAEAGLVYRGQWHSGRDDEATMMGRSMASDAGPLVLELVAGAQAVQVNAGSARVFIGRGADASLALNDPRASRMHTTLAWRGRQFVLSDASSYGTWVHFGNQNEAVMLRRTECYLVGSGQISAGCERREVSPWISFSSSN